jgi:hypothetical protein
MLPPAARTAPRLELSQQASDTSQATSNLLRKSECALYTRGPRSSFVPANVAQEISRFRESTLKDQTSDLGAMASFVLRLLSQ